MRTVLPLAVLLSLLIVAGFVIGCSSDADGAENGSSLVSGELPCDVSALLEEHCRGCHSSPPQFGAPMPLVTYGDLVRADHKGRVLDHVRMRMKDRSMPPPPSGRVAEEKIDLFERWVGGGAAPREPGAICGQGAAPTATTPRALACDADTHVGPAHPYAIKPDVPDEYVCYGFDVTRASKRHVIGLGPRVENASVVHHLLLFRSTEAVSPEPTPCKANPPLDWRLHGAWAPGGDAMMLPPQAGFPEEGISHWVMQVHYSNLGGLTGQVDASGYDLCTTDQLRRYDAGILATGTTDLLIPPRSATDTTCFYNWGAGATGDFRTEHPSIHVFGVMPHMHKLGTSMSVHRLAPGLPRRTLIDSKFEFGSQSTYQVDAVVGQLDQIQTRCSWKNSGDQPVSWGEETNAEMCFAFLSYYPAVQDPLWTWSVPAVSLGTTCYSEDNGSSAP